MFSENLSLILSSCLKNNDWRVINWCLSTAPEWTSLLELCMRYIIGTDFVNSSWAVENTPEVHQVTSSDIGFAAFGVTGRAVIDFALLTSQVSPAVIKPKNRSKMFPTACPTACACSISSCLFYVHPQIGFCCAYLIFISENLSTYIPVSKFFVSKIVFLSTY